MRYSERESRMWYKHGRVLVHPRAAFTDAIRNGMDEECKWHYAYVHSSETMHYFKHTDTGEHVHYNRIHRNKR